MSRGLNKVLIIGTLGQDPETRYAANGNAVVNLSVATNETWKDKQTGEQKKSTEWHRIVMFGKVAEIAGQYLRKGSQAYFEGKLQTRKWQDKDGSDRWSTEILAHEMQMLGPKPEGVAPSDDASRQTTAQPPAEEAKVVDDGFDDIPF